MSLTGAPLLVVSILATAGAVTMTVLLWSRYGHWQLLSRSVGVVLAEALLVVTVGLITNRVQQFYPSWDALLGDTGTAAVVAAQPAGRLDPQFPEHGSAAVRWRPTDAPAWRLATTPTIIAPGGYRQRPSMAFPVVLSLVDGSTDTARAVSAAQHTADAVTVVAAPSTNTTAATLATLPASLSDDLRVTGQGWAIVAATRQLALAAQLINAAPSRFTALIVVGGSPSTGLSDAVRPGNDLAIAVVRPPLPKGSPSIPLPASAIRSAASITTAWATASAWAAQQVSLPLSAPLQLPQAVIPQGRAGPQ